MKSFSWKRVWYIVGLAILTFFAYVAATPNMCGLIGLSFLGPIVAMGAFACGLVVATISRRHVIERPTTLVALGALVGFPLFIFFVAATNAVPMTAGNCAL